MAIRPREITPLQARAESIVPSQAHKNHADMDALTGILKKTDVRFVIAKFFRDSARIAQEEKAATPAESPQRSVPWRGRLQPAGANGCCQLLLGLHRSPRPQQVSSRSLRQTPGQPFHGPKRTHATRINKWHDEGLEHCFGVECSDVDFPIGAGAFRRSAGRAGPHKKLVFTWPSRR